MKQILVSLVFLCLGLGLSAQKTDDSSSAPHLKRTYPIDSCLWFQLPFDFTTLGTRTFSGGTSVVSVFFSSSDPGGGFTRGQGRFIISSGEFPLEDWNWSRGQKGKIQIILPDSAQGGGSEDPLETSNFDNFPILTPGFILEVEGREVSPPFQVNFRLDAMETGL